MSSHGQQATGFTLVEVVLGTFTLTIAAVAILGAYLGQVTLNEHARNLSLAVHDANRILEQIRRQNSGGACSTPSVSLVGGWDAWLQAQNPGKSVPNPAATANASERIVVTCQNEAATQYCNPATQVSASEWRSTGGAPTHDPLRVTVSVCWRHRNRTLGECAWAGNALTPADTNGNMVIDSPAMLTTLVTCRN